MHLNLSKHVQVLHQSHARVARLSPCPRGVCVCIYMPFPLRELVNGSFSQYSELTAKMCFEY